MTALELVSLLTQAVYMLIFLLVETVLRPSDHECGRRFFFGAISIAIVESRIVTTFRLQQVELITKSSRC